MKILVTGATGRVGANLVTALLERGHQVRAFIYPGDASRMGKLDAFEVEQMVGDLRNEDDVTRSVAGIDVVYHIGAAMGAPIGPLDYFDINARGTLNVLEAARGEEQLQQLVYASTDAVYPSDHKTSEYPDVLTEDSDIAPDMPYATSKWIGEALCLNYHRQYGLPVTVLRFACVIGPGELLGRSLTGRGMWLSAMIEALQRAAPGTPGVATALEQLEARWPGENRLLLARNAQGVPAKLAVVDIRDLIQWLMAALLNDNAIGEMMNVPGPEPVRWEVIVPMASERLGIPYVEANLPLAPPFLYYCETNYEKAQRVLGYTPQHGMASMLDLYIAMSEGQEVGLIPTGVPYGPAE